MSKQLELAALLQKLSAALESGTLAEVSEIYREAEALSVAMLPAKADKSNLMQVVRKHLMQAFGPELMRVGTDINGKQLAEYDVAAELEVVVEELEFFERVRAHGDQ